MVQTMTDEDRLIELLQSHQSLSEQATVLAESPAPEDAMRRNELEPQRQKAQDDILELVETYFRRALRPVVAKVFGAGVLGQPVHGKRADGSLRYTAMVNDFFVKVLDKRPDAFWKAKTAAALRTWSSVVIANQMRDYLRRKKKGQQILHDEIAPLVEQQQKYYEARHRTTFEEFLDQLAAWESSGDETLARQARAMRHHYVDGMTWGQVAEQLGITDERLTKLRQAAAEQLQKL